MSTIRCIYRSEPPFPASDQHPDAVRYRIGSVWVDALGGQPTQAEIDALLSPDPTALDTATLNAALIAEGSVVRALAMVMLDEINALRTKAGMTTRTLAQLKTALLAKMR